ncbi:flavin-nucleotide-binding protein-like protein [Natronorubrum sulfidifaciens JCM 14089]|uniref:Flavin-nucleotide-binding protein-like protein n=1 Tax=Natronorubrum sulfidifaciens JCM 14089 TaxID=1230460 RepID=L9W6V1_9EURY|nr:flavin-nucleotide-binding protein-like protein [Natronorubrum sulfidifaciens JCM 14089]
MQLSGQERNEFLGTGGTGVLSFTRGEDEPPASFPVSYGYYDDDECFYFRLSFPPSSAKASVIENPVSFVTYADDDDGWHSIVATGTLEELTDLPHESVAVQGMWAVDIPTVEIFDRPRSEITFHDFRLEPERIRGRKETQ